MAKYSSKDCVFLVDGYNILGVTTQIEPIIEALTQETTALGDEWETHKYLGINRAEFAQEGFFDDASDSSNDALSGKQGESRVMCVGYEGNTIGKHFTGFQGELHANYARIASKGALHRANARYVGGGIVEDGLILHALAARSADGDTKSTPVQHGSSTSDGGAAYLQVPSLTLGGYTSVTIRVLERDGSTWATLATFTAVTAAPVAERITVAGTIEQDLAVEWVFNGSGSNPSITFLVGFVRY